MLFSILGAQPLTIGGITGLISLFNDTIYDIIARYDVSIYPQFICWTAIWAPIFHWLTAIWNTCDYMRYVTVFSIKGVEELVSEFSSRGSIDGYLNCTFAILYFATIYVLEKLGSNTIFNLPSGAFWTTTLTRTRKPGTNILFQKAKIFWVSFAHIPGHLREANIGKVPITKAFHPTQPRSRLIDFWELDNISSLTSQSRQFLLKNSGGFHWDFFLLGCTTFVAGILGLSMPNGLVPQAPLHTDSLTIYETDMVKISTSEGEGAEVRRPIVKATAVVEQRVSHFFTGLALIGTMTGPLLVVLHMGSIESNGIVEKLVFLFKENRFIQRDERMLTVRRWKIALYIGLQLFGVLFCVAVSQTIAAIGECSPPISQPRSPASRRAVAYLWISRFSRPHMPYNTHACRADAQMVRPEGTGGDG
ncbi:HCO3 protein [Blastomyces dermatitidis ER-3]|uniref:HCO3 protein n=1 Tax=Ajellomyces dermatitidis (strain ER-3 / ATCC MYA-2586) TaxID=559297 RepID=A0ABP2F4K1_AJEDR|nr:HCO3 protein [Blastomyces dermatitidis ER-3]EEQ91891.2 HCO3 protein [Blastomyces dermatitidis ER-3]